MSVAGECNIVGKLIQHWTGPERTVQNGVKDACCFEALQINIDIAVTFCVTVCNLLNAKKSADTNVSFVYINTCLNKYFAQTTFEYNKANSLLAIWWRRWFLETKKSNIYFWSWYIYA